MSVHLGSVAPDFAQDSTQGTIRFHEWIAGKWVMFFSFPHDFTPVCTSELGVVARLGPEFARRDCKVIAVSVDTVDLHRRWLINLKNTQHVDIQFPILSDRNLKVSGLYDLIHKEMNEEVTVRGLFVIDPKKRIRLSMYYPDTIGRNFREVLRAIDALQLINSHSLLTTDRSTGDENSSLPPQYTE